MKRIWLSNLALIVVLALGVAYVLIYVVRIDPTETRRTVTVELAQTGGLLERADVTYLGVPVGKVEQIGLRKDGVVARLTLDSGIDVPVDSEAVVAGLSAVGEQHLDLRPRSTGGPYLSDGARIAERDTHTPRPFAELLTHVGAISDQLEPRKLGIIVDELAAATDGTAPDLRRILTGGRYLLTGLEDVLPETVNILRDGHTTLTTVADLTDELERFGAAGRTVGAALRKGDKDIRELLDSSPSALRLVTDVLEESGPRLGTLFGEVGQVTRLVNRRLPAFASYLPTLTEAGDKLPDAAHDGGLHVAADIFPRPMCDYGTPRRAPTIGGSPDPRLDGRCTTYGPDLQQRGAYNAPRPGGAEPRTESTGGQTSQRTLDAEPGPAEWYAGYVRRLLGG